MIFLKKKVIIKFIRNQLGNSNNKYEKYLVKFHDNKNISYSPFDYINLEEEYYNKYKKMSENEKEKNTIFGFIHQDNLNFYSKSSNNFGFVHIYNSFDEFLQLSTKNFKILYYDQTNEFWVPFPEIYPEEFDKWQKFNFDNQNFKEEDIKKISEEKKIFLKQYAKNKEEKDFRFLIKNLFLKSKETKSIHEMIKLFPTEIKGKLKNQLDKIGNIWYNFWNKENNKWICYYNFTIELYHIFKERYNKLSNINKSNDEVKKIVVDLNKEYYNIKEIQANEINENIKRLYELENNYNKIKVENQFETIVDKYEVMLLNEKDFKEKKHPEKKSKEDKPIYKELNYENNMQNLNNKKNIGMTVNKLENIEVPKEISIMNLSNFYSKCIQATKDLPLVVRDIFLSENVEAKDFNIIEDNYKKLKQLYYNLNNNFSQKKIKDSSILSFKINQFIDSFESMVMKFKNAAPELDFGVSIKLDTEINDFIKEPNLDEFILEDNEWKSEEPLLQNNFYLNEKKLNIYHKKKEEEKKDSKKYFQITKEDVENEKKNNECIKDDKQINLTELIKEKEINENEEDEINDLADFNKEEDEEGDKNDSKSKPISNKEEKKNRTKK